MMDALEVGRVNVAARGVGIAQRALELGLKYAQERTTFGKPIAEHQAIQFKLADMATKVEAARLLMLKAARMKDAGERSDVEAGMAKLFASETGKEVVEDSFRIHGGYGYSKEYEIERLYRDAPLLLIGEGTTEIQRMVIGRKLMRATRSEEVGCSRAGRGRGREDADRDRGHAVPRGGPGAQAAEARRRRRPPRPRRRAAVPRRDARGRASPRTSRDDARVRVEMRREFFNAMVEPRRTSPTGARPSCTARPRRPASSST